MTHDQFLAIVGYYKSFIKPNLYQQIIENVDRFTETDRHAVMQSITVFLKDILGEKKFNEISQEFYQEGKTKLHIFFKEETQELKKGMVSAEANNRKEETLQAEQLLT